MANKLNLKKIDLPDDWNDDIRMNFLFAAFREKTANPEGWDAKMKFWVNFIQDVCVKCETPVIHLNMLRSALERKGNSPQCLHTVLENMYNQGLITSLTNFSKIEPEKGWIGWGFDMLVQKPVSWGFSTVQSLLKWAKKDDQFVVVSVVKDLATKLLQRHSELVNSELTDNVIFLDMFEEQCKDICSYVNFKLAVIQLQKDKHAYVFEDRGRKIIKFRSKEDKNIKPLSELERGIINLQTAKDKLMDDIDILEKDIISSTEEIKQMLRSGFKTKATLEVSRLKPEKIVPRDLSLFKAMFSLKKKKRLEAVLQKKSVAVDNIENLLCQLQNSDSEKMVLAAYKAGSQAIKVSLKDDFNLDLIDNTMAEVEGAIDDYAEVQKTLSKPVTPDNESLDDFEDELNELLANEKKPNTQQKEPSPSKMTDDDLLRRLSALRSPPEGVPPIKKLAMNKRLAESFVH